MPGLAMDANQVNPGRLPEKDESFPIIKNEHAGDDTLSDFEEAEAEESYTYKPRPQLPKPFVVMRSLAHLIKDLETGLIDVNPEYQREVVWTADRMTGLIDSLMENFYVPPIILNKNTTPSKGPREGVHVCVDGKQRLSSVRAFVSGMIPCHDHRGEKWWFCETVTSRRKKVLSEDMQKLFLAKEFVSFEFKDLSPEQEEDLFARVQMGVQLSLAEKMRAQTGPWQELARLFVDDFPMIYSLMKDRARAKDFQVTLSAFSQILEVMHPSSADGVPTLKTNHTALPKFLKNTSAVNDRIKSKLASVWNTFKELIELDRDTFTNANKYLRGVQTFAPIELVAVAVLISEYADTRNNHLLLGDIKAMREAIREHYADIRMNTSVWRFIWDFIEKLEAIRGAVDESTVDRSARPVNNTAIVPRSPAVSLGTKRGRLTARTKPPTVLPTRKPSVVKREEGEPSTSQEPRPPKRQRTHPSLTGPSPPIIQNPNSMVSGSSSPVPSHVTSSAPRTQNQHSRTSIPPSGIDSLSAPLSSSAIQSQNHLSGPVVPTLEIETQRADNPRQSQTPAPFVPPRTQNNYASELNNGYKAPAAPMLSFQPADSTAPSRPTGSSLSPTDPTPRAGSTTSMTSTAPSVSEDNGTTASRVSSTGPAQLHRPTSNDYSTQRRDRGTFTPAYTMQQWDGELRSVSPNSEIPTRRQKPSRPTSAQINNAIDLTSDDEEERQNLLSSFKATALAEREKQQVATPVSTQRFLFNKGAMP